MAVKRMIKYEVERDPQFAGWVAGVIGGERVRNCIQCGLCSASCPLSPYMDYTPRRLIHMAREGFKRDVLGSFTIWLCTSCYSCTVECPRRIRVTDVMYALKRRAIEDGVYPKRFPIPVLASEFGAMIRRKGRVTESWLILRVFLKTAIIRLLGMSKLGSKLFFSGRMGLVPESIRDRKQLQTLLDAVETHKEVAA
ncbi:MAG: 4Fe-4S dicluster domain-containing protein [Acidobacteriia bacterium]|jgi:quinone-modifying oxidoreductase subunit QmoC|nr:4Fe-4S dicluster domain-containing protein [Terriglobia bacterium]